MRPFSERLLAWFDQWGRHDLPWQGADSPYPVWISEIMLQQTQVGTVIPYFERFIARFPHCASLASAPLDEVLHHWSGLGYYARARNLHRTAILIQTRYHGEFPREHAAWIALPGIGRSTASAILALSHGLRHPILDGNVKRVLARQFGIEGWPELPAVQQQLWTIAEGLTPQSRIADYTQAIMDLGATLCTRSAPRCDACPVASTCVAHIDGRTTDLPSRRPRRALPRRRTAFLILENCDGALLLEKRPPSGIWGGLWSFPEVSEGSDYLQWCTHQGLRTDGEFRELPTIDHTFTHFQLAITPLACRISAQADACMDSDRWLWYNCDAPALVGLAKPVAHILSMRQKSMKGART
ncbi:MAG: adenine DNA glycosylase [Gammaproteobacteria bacterium]|nr:adenine DNA glycosylase [Gammaproteobacteria bacterium]